MKKIIVTGCNGQLGKAINQVFADEADVTCVNTDVAELDITNIDEVMKFVKDVNPYAIINCAAHTNVDACETEFDKAFRINAMGPRNLSIASSEVGAKLVHISTDYVFPGDGRRPYREFDEIGPKSAYGETKYIGEKMVRQFADRYYIMRTAWMYGDGKNFVKTMLRIAENNNSVTVVDDQIGTPTYSVELAKAIASQLKTDNYGTFHSTCEGQCSWYDFTKEIYRLAGKKMDVIPVSTEEYLAKFPAQAHRPAYSVLDNYMLRMTTGYKFAEWHDAFAAYMETL